MNTLIGPNTVTLFSKEYTNTQLISIIPLTQIVP